MEKLITWLVVLIAVVFLARPQSDKVMENTQISASAKTEISDDKLLDGAVIVTAVITVIIIAALADYYAEN